MRTRIEYQGIVYNSSVAFYCSGMVRPDERSCFIGLNGKEAIRELQKHKTDNVYWQDYEFEWIAIMIGVLVTQKVADWNFHKYVGFFHNYLFDMLGEYLATGAINYSKYREKYYKEINVEVEYMDFFS